MIKGIIALLIIFSCAYTAGATEILVADWTTYESHISLTNASTNTITFILMTQSLELITILDMQMEHL